MIKIRPTLKVPRAQLLQLAILWTLSCAHAAQVPYLSPEESAKHFQVPPGYRLELVLSEPDIREPVAIEFDGDGNLFVVEMRTYMQDIDGTGEHEPTSRISMHRDTDGDGIYDRHTAFVDQVLLPRMILPVGDALLVGLTDSNDILRYRDTNDDGIADEKVVVYEGGKRGGNMEHQPSGLLWSIDNWIYTTYNAYRLRYRDNTLVKEPTAPNGGQWGLTQDDYGKPWFVNAGGERGPLNFQVPIVYGAVNTDDQFEPDFKVVYPIVPIPDVQGGTKRFRPEEKTLNHFTATCGAVVYRGDRLPEDLRGDLLFAEPVGRLIRRSKVEVTEGVTRLRNAYPGSEFIRSTDPNFRPVNMNTAPDGSLLIVDMYRGIIQEGNWVRPGSYLRGVVQEYGLDRNFGRGRIWRLVHEDHKKGPAPQLLGLPSSQLVPHLSHSNGWWRDNAQRQLILNGDLSVRAELESMTLRHSDHKARIHALWTLEGLDALEKSLILQAVEDPHPMVRQAALRVAETLHKNGQDMTEVYEKATRDPAAEVALQAVLSSRLLKIKPASGWLTELASNHPTQGARELAKTLLKPASSGGNSGNRSFTTAENRLIKNGQAIYQELCFACHGPDGKGMPMEGAPKGTTLAPPFAGSPTLLGPAEAPIAVVLHGLTGPVRGKTYEALMVPMATQDDRWIASVLSYIRTTFGNRASTITPQQVRKVRSTWKERSEPWTLAELESYFPTLVPDRKSWKLSTSHRANNAKAAVDGDLRSRWDTGTSQVPGMWFQVELPQPVNLAGILLDAGGSTRDYPRGYQVQVSLDGEAWSPVLAKGTGEHPVVEVLFPSTEARFLRITQTGGVQGLFWSIHEMELYQAAQKEPGAMGSASRKSAPAFE